MTLSQISQTLEPMRANSCLAGGDVKVRSLLRKITLATPNYGYEKRQKELAKKRKKEDKLKNKTERKGTGDFAGSDSPDTGDQENKAGEPSAGSSIS